jgi:hypothetical protein
MAFIFVMMMFETRSWDMDRWLVPTAVSLSNGDGENLKTREFRFLGDVRTAE